MCCREGFCMFITSVLKEERTKRKGILRVLVIRCQGPEDNSILASLPPTITEQQVEKKQTNELQAYKMRNIRYVILN